jgi:hypothetical protein
MVDRRLASITLADTEGNLGHSRREQMAPDSEAPYVPVSDLALSVCRVCLPIHLRNQLDGLSRALRITLSPGQRLEERTNCNDDSHRLVAINENAESRMPAVRTGACHLA